MMYLKYEVSENIFLLVYYPTERSSRVNYFFFFCFFFVFVVGKSSNNHQKLHKKRVVTSPLHKQKRTKHKITKSQNHKTRL